MNSEVNVNARMLMLYPIHIVKSHFNVVGHKGIAISQIATTRTTTEIDTFAASHINRNKQHIYIFNLNPPFDRNTFNIPGNPFPFTIMHEVVEGGSYHFYIKPQVIYYATIVNLETNTSSQIEMIFTQPIHITVNNTHLIIRATILERNVSAYMNSRATKSFNVTKSNNDDFVNDIVSYFLGNYGVVSCNLNRGVKHLCDNNILDFKSLQIINSDSTDTIVMNEDLTFKIRYPLQYANTMRAPLIKSAFKYLLDDEALCDTFTADPNTGQINIPLYPKTATQIENVIAQILTNN